MTRVDAKGTVEQAAERLRACRHVVALTGAGLSAESGIPTYRGSGGIWTKWGEPTIDGWELFNSDPGRWWEEAIDRQTLMSDFAQAIDRAEPNPGHLAMAELERMGRLHHVITQNIDDLHRRAGSRAVTEIHGNRHLVRCMSCGRRDRQDAIFLERLPPLCQECGGILKNDTVMFGEPIPADVLDECHRQANLADAFLVVGTSAVVYPAAEFPAMAKRRGAALLELNPEPTPLSRLADVVVRAPAGESLPRLAALLGTA
ncbi:MAG: NAD-dependent deacylase [Dehalococcoidia bacterium]|nr:NAD-dependent deacylase [Dehalococcoidia bacterium]